MGSPLPRCSVTVSYMGSNKTFDLGYIHTRTRMTAMPGAMHVQIFSPIAVPYVLRLIPKCSKINCE